jgi:hypothetical protein
MQLPFCTAVQHLSPVHETESQTHAPLLQRCPAWHGAPLPHAHCPFTHESENPPRHGMHAPASMPHALALVAVTHALPMQHPFGHETESQTQCPCAQCWPTSQVAPAPHWQVAVFPASTH